MKRKIIWSAVALLAIFTFAARWNVHVPCQQCGKTCIQEPLLARFAAHFDKGFLHLQCVDQYLKDHPIRLDEQGRIINPDERPEEYRKAQEKAKQNEISPTHHTIAHPRL
jgi:hypothetical protein